MTEAILDIKQWGNNLGVRLPAAIAREAHLHVNQRVRISVENNHVVITPIDDAPLTGTASGRFRSCASRRRSYDDQSNHWSRALVTPKKLRPWAPDRQDIIWIATRKSGKKCVMSIRFWCFRRASLTKRPRRSLDYP